MAGNPRFPGYDRKLISILEILAAQTVDVYFNHVFRLAQSRVKAGASLTDEYMTCVQSYIIGVKSDEGHYRKVVHTLHTFARSATRYKTLSFSDFVDLIVGNFIPPEYYQALQTQEKDETLNSIVVDLIATMGVNVSSPGMLHRVIDEHEYQPSVTIRMLQDQAVNCLLAKRGEINTSFLRKVGQTRESVSMDVVDDLKRAIRKLAKQKARLQSALSLAEEQISELEDEQAAQAKREAKFRKLIGLLQAERENGLERAAHNAAVPPRDDRAERRVAPRREELQPSRDDRAESRRAGGVRGHSGGVPPRDDTGELRGAEFFAEPTDAPRENDFFAAPVAAAPAARRGTVDLTSFVTALAAGESPEASSGSDDDEASDSA